MPQPVEDEADIVVPLSLLRSANGVLPRSSTWSSDDRKVADRVADQDGEVGRDRLNDSDPVNHGLFSVS
jgi:hypothetical protein